MNGLLGELGKKLAERWLSLLVLPGALFLSVALIAHTLGHRHPFDVALLTTRLTEWAKAPMVTTTAGGQVVVLAGVLAGAALSGLVVQALGSAVERAVLGSGWRGWWFPWRQLAGSLVSARKSRWSTANAEYHRQRERARNALISGQQPDRVAHHLAYQRRARIAVEPPDRPTWSGDRVHAAAVRLDRDLHLDLVTVWPLLWLILPEQVRAEITAARQTISRSTTLAGWTLPYAVLVIWWWPAAIVAGIIAVTSRQRLRRATDEYALLLEAAMRTHAGDVARQLGISQDEPFTPENGDLLTHLLHTEPPAPDEPN